jgi:uncharacterized protein (TIGR03382 family)
VGSPDVGSSDAGEPADAAVLIIEDAAAPPDAAPVPPDAALGSEDATLAADASSDPRDAARPADGSSHGPSAFEVGCGCGQGGHSGSLLLALLASSALRRRRSLHRR